MQDCRGLRKRAGLIRSGDYGWLSLAMILLVAAGALADPEPAPTVTVEPTGTVELAVTVELADSQVTLELPLAWDRIPDDELELFSLEAAEQSGGRAAEIYQHGFAPAAARSWFDYPFILIQSKQSGRLDLALFRELPTVKELRQNRSERIREAAGELIRNLRAEQISFDDEAYVLHVQSTVEVVTVGLVVVNSASYLSQKGVIMVHCYGLATRREQNRDLFEQVLASVCLAKGLAYQPRFSERWPLLASFDWRHWTLLAMMVIILGLLAYLVPRRRR